MVLRRLPFSIAPWPNTASTLAVAFAIWYIFIRTEEYQTSLFAGALVGLIPAVIDAATRPSVRSALLSASNLAEVGAAYRSNPLARSRHAVAIALLSIAGYLMSDLYSNSDYLAAMLAGFAFVHFLSHAILGFWTAWPAGDRANAH
jgi:hypothetical protein